MSAWVPRFLIVLFVGLIGYSILSIAVGESGPRAQQIGGVNDVQRIFGGIQQNGAYLGEEDAPVTVTVFNDIQCADCAAYQVDEIDPLVEPYVRPGDVRMELIHISTIARNSTVAGIASAAASLQDRGWQYADTFVRNFEGFDQSVGEDELTDVADSVPELEIEGWEAALDGDEAQQIAEADAQLAIDLGLDDQPAVEVSGPSDEVLLDDSPSSEEIEAAIEDVA